MTKDQFAAMCGELLIDPGIALENENVVAALKTGEADAVLHVLTTEF